MDKVIVCDVINKASIDKTEFKHKPNEVKFEESIALLPSNVNNSSFNKNSNLLSARKRNLSVESSVSDNTNQLKCNNNRNGCNCNSSIAVPPDGGWGWVVVFASFMINLISDGVSLSFGIIFMELNDYFGESKSKTAWVGSLFLSIPLITGPIASALTDHFGCRRVAICGSLMSATGFIAGQFATKLEHLFIAFSFSGFGLALCYVTSIVSVAYYFEKRRSLATGLAVCGTGFGTFLFAPLTIFLLNEYGWRGTLLILGAIFLNIVNFGALYRDLNLNNNSTHENARDLENTCDKDCYSNSLVVNNKIINQIYREDQSTEDESQQLTPNRLCSSLIHIPTYIRQNGSNSVSNEIIGELSCRRGGYLRRLLHRHPKLIGFFMPQEYDNDFTIKNLPSTSNAPNSHTKPIKSDNNFMVNKNEKKNVANAINPKKPLIRTLSKKEPNIEGILKNTALPTAEMSPLSSNYLRNLRLQRGSLTYRSAMLNIRKYQLRASSAPDIYRNSMVAIDEKSCGFLYDLKNIFLDMIDLSNFKSFRYSLFCVSNFLLYACIDVPYVYLPDQAIITGVADKEAASFLISIIGISNTLGVVFVGFIGDKPWIDPSLLYSCFIAVSGVSLAVMPWIYNYLGMALLAALYGFTISVNYALVSVILVNLISLDSFTNAYGLLLLVQGFGSLVGPPIAGYLYDMFGNYNSAFYLTGVCVFISGALVAPIARSSNCITIEDSSTEVTESSRPCSPKIDDITNSINETNDKSKNLLNITNLNDKTLHKDKYNIGIISKSFENVSKPIM